MGGGHSTVEATEGTATSTWDQGRVRHRAQEEGAKLWAREGAQFQGIASWHVRVLERAARRELNEQAQQGWASIVKMEGPRLQPAHGMSFWGGTGGTGADSGQVNVFATDGGGRGQEGAG